MSKSYRKTPIFGMCGSRVSEKFDKRKANRKLRKRIKSNIKKGYTLIFPLLREVSDVWEFAKDGKIYNHKIIDKWMRK